jgi:putative hydrolase of the HAD superfamily
MKAKSDADASESSWDAYNDAYVAAVGVDPDDRDEAAAVLDRTRYHHTWRWVIPESRAALGRLASLGVPMGVVSNASGQIEAMLRREIAQVGSGPHVEMRVIVDSQVVGVAKPDPTIFDHALRAFREFEIGRIAYVGDSVTMDIASATAAGLHPMLLDPYDDHVGADFERIGSLADLVDEFA